MKRNNLKKKIEKLFNIRIFRGGNLITYVEAKELLKENPNGVIIDVRSIQEYNEYHLNGAICIPLYELQSKIPNIIENKNQMLIVCCQSGTRSKKAINILSKMGYTNLYEIEGGLDNI